MVTGKAGGMASAWPSSTHTTPLTHQLVMGGRGNTGDPPWELTLLSRLKCTCCFLKHSSEKGKTTALTNWSQNAVEVYWKGWIFAEYTNLEGVLFSSVVSSLLALWKCIQGRQRVEHAGVQPSLWMKLSTMLACMGYAVLEVFHLKDRIPLRMWITRETTKMPCCNEYGLVPMAMWNLFRCRKGIFCN